MSCRLDVIEYFNLGDNTKYNTKTDENCKRRGERH